MAKAKKVIPVVDDTAGTPIELIDSRIDIDNPTNEDVLMYNSLSGKFEANSIGAVVTEVALTGDYNDLANKPVLVCNYDTSNNTMDKTPAEIVAAKTANKIVICKLSYPTTDFLLLNQANSNPFIVFTGLSQTTSSTSVLTAKFHVLRYTTTDGWKFFTFGIQQQLVSGTNIKTINGNSLLGSDDLTISDVFVCNYTETDSTNHTGIMNKTSAEIVAAKASGKVVLCVQGGQVYCCVAAFVSALNVAIVQFMTSTPLDNGGDYVRYIYNHNGGTTWHRHDIIIQEKLVSGTNIKTINGNSLLGSGDLIVGGGGVTVDTEISETSTNPVQNKAIGAELRKLWDKKDIVSRLDNEYESHNNYIATASGKWVSSSTYKHWVVPINDIREVTVVANSSTAAYVSFFDTYSSTTSGTTPDYSTGWDNAVAVTAGTSRTFKVPDGAAYMYLNTGSNNGAKAAHIYFTGISITDEFELPSLNNNAGKVLAVNSNETDVEWVTQSGGGGTAHKETVYAVCSTAAATQTKEITVSEMPQHGDLIVVNFEAGISVANPTLRVSDGNQYVDLSMLFCGNGLPSGLIRAGEMAIFSVDFYYRRARMISSDFATATALKAVKIYHGTTTPSSSLGSDGDIYIQTA